MNGEKLYITRQDYERLCKCIAAASAGPGAGKEELREFGLVENISAVIVSPPTFFPFHRRAFLNFSRENRRFCL